MSEVSRRAYKEALQKIHDLQTQSIRRDADEISRLRAALRDQKARLLLVACMATGCEKCNNPNPMYVEYHGAGLHCIDIIDAFAADKETL